MLVQASDVGRGWHKVRGVSVFGCGCLFISRELRMRLGVGCVLCAHSSCQCLHALWADDRRTECAWLFFVMR